MGVPPPTPLPLWLPGIGLKGSSSEEVGVDLFGELGSVREPFAEAADLLRGAQFHQTLHQQLHDVLQLATVCKSKSKYKLNNKLNNE